jgi:hypothetical protein
LWSCCFFCVKLPSFLVTKLIFSYFATPIDLP